MSEFLDSRNQPDHIDRKFDEYAGGVLVKAKRQFGDIPGFFDVITDLMRMSYRAGYKQSDEDYGVE